jgi:hypothetical protein
MAVMVEQEEVVVTVQTLIQETGVMLVMVALVEAERLVEKDKMALMGFLLKW